MMVMWEHKSITVKEMGQLLYLDSGTLTPMLKKMEKAGWLKRRRSSEDERVVILSITEAGERLQEQAAEVPLKMQSCVKLSSEDAMQLYRLLHELMNTLNMK